MSPRPRSTTDEQILDAAERALERVGPTDLSLADIGREAGVAPATLLQRFGSKRELLLRLVGRADEVRTRLAEARARSRSALGAAVRLLEAPADRPQTAASLAHRQAFLQMDLEDPDFRERALRETRAMRRAVRNLLKEAVARRELRRCNTSQLAKAAHATATGALALWTVHREAGARRAVRTALAALFSPYRPVRSARARPRRKTARRKKR